MILDVGCGKRKYPNSIGMDIDRNTDADIIADAHFLPFKNGCFDFVYSHHVIEHLKRPKQMLIEVKRILKHGGKFVCRFPNKRSTNSGYYFLRYMLYEFPFILSPTWIKMLKYKLPKIKKRDPSHYHLWIINPQIFEQYFEIEKKIEYGDPVWIFLRSGKKGKFLRKYLSFPIWKNSIHLECVKMKLRR